MTTTKTTTDCGAEGLCQYESLTRTRFFDGMLLTDDHLGAEQKYHREALKRINRLLWGSGIVCGLEVENASGLCLKVHPGAALDCEGNLIEVARCVTIDLHEECKKKYPQACAPPTADPFVKYLVLRYKELEDEPEAVLTSNPDCSGGSETRCEKSRIREGFCIELWDTCPEPGLCGDMDDDRQEGVIASYRRLRVAGGEPAKEQILARRGSCLVSPPCTTCGCNESAVGLAKLTINCVTNTVQVTCECRGLVLSPRLLRWLLCAVFAGMDKADKRVMGLDEKSDPLPPAASFVAQPLSAAWQTAAEYAAMGDQFMKLQDQVQVLQKRLDAQESGQPGPKGPAKRRNGPR